MKIVTAPNNILRQEAKPLKKVTPAILQTVKEMIALTNTFVDPEGVGLAAPQVGISEQFFIAKFDEEFVPFFNPKILEYGKKEKEFLEGCLSIPDYYGEIARPTSIKVSYLTKDNQQITETLKGINAMIFQHEYDHLHGRLFMDIVLQQHARLFKITGKDRSGADIFEEISI